jgi:aminoglycoside phosphotransferase (APT) family kinase protein
LKTNDAVRAVAPHDAARISAALVDTLVDLHAVDYDAIGLGDFGRPEGFLERNLARWGKQWETSKTRELPAIDELRTLLERALPTSGAPTIVHGDYRLDNTMLAPGDLGTIAAVLDWEMSTLGDPLTDVGLFLVYWSNPGHDLLEPSSAIDPAAGWFTREELAARYAERSGRDLSTLDFYVVFAQYKLAVILEGINARFQMGKTVGHGFDTMGPMVETLAESALDIARVSDLPGMH